MNSALIIIDMQNGFMTASTEHIVPPISRLLEEAERRAIPVAFTRFINYPNSGWVKWIRWSRFMESPEIDIIPAFSSRATKVFDKRAYTAFIPAFCDFIQTWMIQRIVLCGVATDGCVLKTAVDAFERDIQPILVADACASHAGVDVHAAGLLLASRFIGKRQIVSVEDVMRQGFDVDVFVPPK
jgi:nicotinamidase-related amidase